MKLAVGADERTHLTDVVIADLQERGHELLLFGHLTETKGNWPQIAQHVAEAVACGDVDEGILFLLDGNRCNHGRQ